MMVFFGKKRLPIVQFLDRVCEFYYIFQELYVSKNKLIKLTFFCASFLLAEIFSFTKIQASVLQNTPEINKILILERTIIDLPQNSLENRLRYNALSSELRNLKSKQGLPIDVFLTNRDSLQTAHQKDLFNEQSGPTNRALAIIQKEEPRTSIITKEHQENDPSSTPSNRSFCDDLAYFFCCFCCCGDADTDEQEYQKETSRLISSAPRSRKKEKETISLANPTTPKGKSSEKRVFESLQINFSHFPESSHLFSSRKVVTGADGNEYFYDTTIRIEPCTRTQQHYSSALNINSDPD